MAALSKARLRRAPKVKAQKPWLLDEGVERQHARPERLPRLNTREFDLFAKFIEWPNDGAAR